MSKIDGTLLQVDDTTLEVINVDDVSVKLDPAGNIISTPNGLSIDPSYVSVIVDPSDLVPLSGSTLLPLSSSDKLPFSNFNLGLPTSQTPNQGSPSITSIGVLDGETLDHSANINIADMLSSGIVPSNATHVELYITIDITKSNSSFNGTFNFIVAESAISDSTLRSELNYQFIVKDFSENANTLSNEYSLNSSIIVPINNTHELKFYAFTGDEYSISDGLPTLSAFTNSSASAYLEIKPKMHIANLLLQESAAIAGQELEGMTYLPINESQVLLDSKYSNITDYPEGSQSNYDYRIDSLDLDALSATYGFTLPSNITGIKLRSTLNISGSISGYDTFQHFLLATSTPNTGNYLNELNDTIVEIQSSGNSSSANYAGYKHLINYVDHTYIGGSTGQDALATSTVTSDVMLNGGSNIIDLVSTISSNHQKAIAPILTQDVHIHLEGFYIQESYNIIGGIPNADSVPTAIQNGVTQANVQDELEQIHSDIGAITGTDDQTAAEVPFTPYLTIGSTDAQAAIQELKDEVDLIVDTDDQTASEVPVTATSFIGNLSATDTNVQTALATLDALVIPPGGTDDQTAAEVPVTVQNGVTQANVQAELEQIHTDIGAIAGTDDQTAAEVPFTPYLTIGSTDAQAAIQELKDEVDFATTSSTAFGEIYEVAGPLINVGTSYQGWNTGSVGELGLLNFTSGTGADPDILTIPVGYSGVYRISSTFTLTANSNTDLTTAVFVDNVEVPTTTTSRSFQNNTTGHFTINELLSLSEGQEIGIKIKSSVASGVIPDNVAFNLSKIGGIGGSIVAANVPITPSGNLISVNVQSALYELQGDIDAISDTDDQIATEVPVTATGFTGNLSATDTDVQTALDTIDGLTVASNNAITYLTAVASFTHDITNPDGEEIVIDCGSFTPDINLPLAPNVGSRVLVTAEEGSGTMNYVQINPNLPSHNIEGDTYDQIDIDGGRVEYVFDGSNWIITMSIVS